MCVDDITRQAGTDGIVGSNVELVASGAPQILQKVRVSSRSNLQLLPVPVVSFVVDYVPY